LSISDHFYAEALPQGRRASIDVVIPALNEERSIGHVLADLPATLVREIVVVDNGSKDATAETACSAGATVLREDRRGYGSACLKGLAYLARKSTPPDVVVFLDADYSDHPEQLPELVAPILSSAYDMVIGSRVLGRREEGALLPQARMGNWLATRLLRLLYGYRFTDLGPFRAIAWPALQRLDMRDPDFGWTVEMQIKAARHGLRCTEVPAHYRRRVGVSKVTGTVMGTLMAGYKILWMLFKYAIRP
jgi:glycosyltransferase involved in cell wall biosynthesis